MTQTFPQEPVRSLDALHLATALLHANRLDAPVVLSVDQQIRANASAVNLTVAP